MAEESGASKRGRAYAARAEAELAENDPCLWAEDFKVAGEPDLDNPEMDLSYVRKLQMISLRQAATTPRPSLLQQAAWRRIREMAAVVGMTSNRAALEGKVKKMQTLLDQKHQSSAVREESGARIKRPTTARGAVDPALRPVNDE